MLDELILKDPPDALNFSLQDSVHEESSPHFVWILRLLTALSFAFAIIWLAIFIVR